MSDDRWQQWSDEMAVTNEVLRAFDGASLESLTPLEHRIVAALMSGDSQLSKELMRSNWRKWFLHPRPEPTHIELELWGEANEALAEVRHQAYLDDAEVILEAWDALDADEGEHDPEDPDCNLGSEG